MKDRLRILSIHNNYKIRGGEDESRESEERLLKEMGHEVDFYEESNNRIDDLNLAQLALKTVWSQESYQAVRQKLKQNRYDSIHVQNFFPLISPSVYYAAKAEDVPVIQTLRNYRLICPNGLFFRDGRVCEDCLGKSIPYPGIIHACYRENRGATAATVAMLTLHRTIGTWFDRVNLFITLSEFARQKFIEAGFPADKMIVKPNFVHPDPGVGSGSGGYALYVGRLSVEKGLDVLLSAWERLSDKVPLKIVGEGPLAELVMDAIERMPHIEWLGKRPIAEVHRLMGEAMFLIFPSKWYETFGRVAIEAFAKGTPVIASNIGAIAELIDPYQTGLCFNPSDPQDLAEKVEWCLNHPNSVLEMRARARAEYEAKYTATQNYQQLIEIYQRLS
ncbi:glycosyltransferase family 4 protein [Chamaesiphon minutus]|uniref:Glycosyltransferase n=1 Tax=Chamaesiphon minutus (strain ATCC 27169 / PCC 6605) TaxID=1173020 RepID=K9UQS3_CHAP6|nr:glycosyltransferase family 4 protein [Chamaesiphon minutus]AFY96781.1 glycosyltransferase [Chamaesiphon minutus PCC 6605]